METKLIAVSEEKLQEEETRKVLLQAGEIIKEGGLVAFPTETVYGLGGDALNRKSSQKIYAAKGRPSDNPLIVHICKWEAIYDIVSEIPENAKKLADAFWPGPLTMIFPKSDRVPLETTGGLSTVAVRMPSDKIALAFIEAAGGYIAAPSANKSGRPSPTVAKYVEEDLSGKIEMILDGGQACIGLESTIVDLTDGAPTILRPGYITKEMLDAVLGEVDMDPTMFTVRSDVAPKAPGMKYRHYAPKAELTIIAGEEKAVVEKINRLSIQAVQAGKHVGIIGTKATQSFYQNGIVKSVGDRKNEETIARELYKVLREFDDEEVDVIYSESFDDSGVGQAIMNRLLKAAGHHVELAE